MLQATSFAQIPDQAKDISPLLYGEKLPEGVLTTPKGWKQRNNILRKIRSNDNNIKKHVNYEK